MHKDDQEDRLDPGEGRAVPQPDLQDIEFGEEPIEVPDTPITLPEDDEVEEPRAQLRVRIRNGEGAPRKREKKKGEKRRPGPDTASQPASPSGQQAKGRAEDVSAQSAAPASAGKGQAAPSGRFPRPENRPGQAEGASAGAPDAPTGADHAADVAQGEAAGGAPADRKARRRKLLLIGALCAAVLLVCAGVYFGMRLVSGQVASPIEGVSQADRRAAEQAMDAFFSDAVRQSMARQYLSNDTAQMQTDLQSLYNEAIGPFATASTEEADAYAAGLMGLFNMNMQGIAFQAMAEGAAEEADAYGHTKGDYQSAADAMFQRVDAQFPLLKQCRTEAEIVQWISDAGLTDGSGGDEPSAPEAPGGDAE